MIGEKMLNFGMETFFILFFLKFITSKSVISNFCDIFTLIFNRVILITSYLVNTEPAVFVLQKHKVTHNDYIE